MEVDGEGGEPRQIAPLNGPPAPNYYHKGPPAGPKDESSPDDPDGSHDPHDPHHDDDEEGDDQPCDRPVGNGVGGGSGHSLSSKCVAMYARGGLRDHARRSAKSAGPMKYQPIQSVASFFARILSRPTWTLAWLMDNGEADTLDIWVADQTTQSMETYYVG